MNKKSQSLLWLGLGVLVIAFLYYNLPIGYIFAMEILKIIVSIIAGFIGFLLGCVIIGVIENFC